MQESHHELPQYNDYTGTVEYSDEDECLFGRIMGIHDLISYEGESVSELKNAFHKAVDDYINHCKEIGKVPNRAYSGRFMLRIDPAIHAKLAIHAQAHGKSLNQYASEILGNA